MTTKKIIPAKVSDAKAAQANETLRLGLLVGASKNTKKPGGMAVMLEQAVETLRRYYQQD